MDCIVKGCGAVTGRQVSFSADAVCSCIATAGERVATPAQITIGDIHTRAIVAARGTTSNTVIVGGLGPGGGDSGPAGGGCFLCPPNIGPPKLPAIPAPGGSGPNNDPNDPNNDPNDPSTSSPSSSSQSSSAYQTGQVIFDYIVTDDLAAAQSLAAEIISEESQEACMTVTTSLKLVGTPCAPTSQTVDSNPSTTSAAPTTIEPQPTPSYASTVVVTVPGPTSTTTTVVVVDPPTSTENTPVTFCLTHVDPIFGPTVDCTTFT